MGSVCRRWRGILDVNCEQCVVFSRWDEGCVGVFDKTVKLWDVTSGECLQTLEGHSHLCEQCVVFSSVRRGLDKTVKLWDVTECLQTLEGHSASVWSVSFSPDGTKVASVKKIQDLEHLHRRVHFHWRGPAQPRGIPRDGIKSNA